MSKSINNSIELTQVVELNTLKVLELISNSTSEQLVQMIELHYRANHKGSLPNMAETVLTIDSIKSNYGDYSKLVEFIIKQVVISTVRVLPLTVLISQVAETMLGRKATNRFRIAAILISLVELAGVFSVYTDKTRDGYNERIISLKTIISSVGKEELLLKSWKLPTVLPSKATIKYSGHTKKIKADNDHFSPIIGKLNNTGYTLDARVWTMFKYKLAAYRFVDTSTQNSMIAQGDNLIGTTFYFNHRMGIDNGRIYPEGDLFTLHGGALNYAFKFINKEICTPRGLEVLRNRVAELEADLDTLSFKEQVEYYSLSLDLIDAEHGKPIGTILHIDAKLSGLQHQCIATRNKSEALYCGLLSELKDGYGHLKSKLSNADSLTRQMVKDAYNPYQYGAGSKATIAPVVEAGGRLDFTEWTVAYKSAFPNAFRLRSYLVSLAKDYKADTYTFTTPSGFNAVVTALGQVTDSITTVYGKLEYSRNEIDKDFMGVKLVAAFSHMQDASSVHHVVLGSTFDMHIVHDSFGSHPNHVDAVEELYIDSLRKHLSMPVLRDFVANIVGMELADANVSRLIDNTLEVRDIVAGLY